MRKPEGGLLDILSRETARLRGSSEESSVVAPRCWSWPKRGGSLVGATSGGAVMLTWAQLRDKGGKKEERRER